MMECNVLYDSDSILFEIDPGYPDYITPTPRTTPKSRFLSKGGTSNPRRLRREKSLSVHKIQLS